MRPLLNRRVGHLRPPHDGVFNQEVSEGPLDGAREDPVPGVHTAAILLEQRPHKTISVGTATQQRNYFIFEHLLLLLLLLLFYILERCS